ncbi:hypothetical protein LRS74_32290 [Streptomyces sp. LX-29]|uniref:hypothetical protein n=1 Tax=Streptomyces sp. LX-29 TaxID=2900152 RepID=UPI00240D0E3C|nr:hypothetical protein [Streptomyces sp. LX-29]WFB11194.1 hypothetical protein LRS74_32290 [Streptomyces sp. LX-29]
MTTKDGASEYEVQRTRAWAGFLVVALGDLAIAVAAIWGVDNVDSAQSVAILSSAFTAISTMTTAYFGIRAVTNAAQAHAKAPPAAPPEAAPVEVAPPAEGRRSSGDSS